MIRVAGYCRVSTDKADQANSFEAQQRYFKEYINRQPEWELYEVYADEGITGTSTKKRVEFNRMISDAQEGKFRLILTKEVSRFSRNILDTISFTRELKAIGIGVLFVNDGIDTLDPDAELRLSIMGSIAQEESRKTSSRVKWGQTRQMERGVVFGRSLLGYDVKDGKLTVNPEGAEIVRQIFHKYGMEKKGTSVIARELKEAGYLTHSGNAAWSSSSVVKILKNEKYVGDLVQKKTITPDYLTHEKKYNHGEEERVVLEHHHEAIIDRELWNIVQEELQKRKVHRSQETGHSNRYIFSGKIKCGDCGASFVSRKKYRRDGSFYKRWGCYTAAKEGKKHLDVRGNAAGCDIGKMLREDLAMEMLKEVLQSINMDRRWIVDHVTALAAETVHIGKQEKHEGKLEEEIGRILQKKEKLLDAFLAGDITREEMLQMKRRYDRELSGGRERLEEVRMERGYDSGKRQSEVRQQVEEIVNGQRDSEVFYKHLLDKMIVFRDGRVEVQLNFLPKKWVFLLEKGKQ